MATVSSCSPLVLEDESATIRLGSLLAGAFCGLSRKINESGFNLRLDGTLGAGKTTLTRAMLRALGITGRVKSPTFTLVETYDAPFFTVHHFDFYRFESPEEFDDAGFRDLFGPGKLTVCEWSEKALPFLPAPDLTISLSLFKDGRKARLEPCGEAGDAAAREVCRQWI
ncbi:MAG: tRNA (adenosine(37)-N6)-threonylcarbamoyltransferase complex ATPase subunit type 1 TsaE [Mesosutterella sp.]|nr:tRNA (adenosine(37)-N6)-threonylcarbamoyltransferase complex ATPase subunit type 1 TsaE [Mesosutterella sp.]